MQGRFIAYNMSSEWIFSPALPHILFTKHWKLPDYTSSFKFIKKNWENTKYDVPLLAVSYSYSRRAGGFHTNHARVGIQMFWVILQLNIYSF